MHNSVLSIRITSLHGSQPSCVVFACKPAYFGPKLHASMCPRTHLWFSACKTACLASELLVSMDPSPHLWFLHSKQRLLDPKTNLYGSQTSPVVLCMQYSLISTRITFLYGPQPLSVVLACKTATFGAELQVSMCSSSHLWFLHAQQRILDQNFKSVRFPYFICGFEHT